MLIVYFSSVTENTRRFVEKLNLPAVRIPLRSTDAPLTVDEPYVLITPTYGGGATVSHQNSQPVPRQVIKFLNDKHNRSFIRAVIAGGNTNFGTDFGLAGEVIAKKCQVPYVYRYELFGTEEDVRIVRDNLLSQAGRLGLNPLAEAASGTPSSISTS